MCVAAVGAALWGSWFWASRIRLLRDQLATAWQPTGRNTPLQWKGLRERMRRGFFWHDDMIGVRLLGDTESIERIMDRLPESGDVTGCFHGHAAEALRGLTAHDAGNTAEGWRAWWRTHQGKSQYTLIRESFAPLGIDPRKPPTKEQTLELLRLVGVGSALGSDGGLQPGAPRPGAARTENALRILRDHEVKPEVVTHSDLLRPEGETIFHGLTRYIEFREQYPVQNGVGVVFGDSAGDIYFDYRDDPFYFEVADRFFGGRWAPWVWFGGVAGLGIGGVWGGWLLWRSRCNRNNFCKSEPHS